MTDKKSINTEQVISYLNHSFAKATHDAADKIGRDNTKGTDLYKYQVDFCYLIDEIQRGPVYIVPKLIQEANDLIAEIEQM